jgi:hypothetical protein
MKKYIVYFGLMDPEREEIAPLIERIQEVALEWWIHPFASVWVITSNYTATQIKDSLSAYLLDDEDTLIVAEISKNIAWSGISGESEKQLKSNFYISGHRKQQVNKNLSLVHPNK